MGHGYCITCGRKFTARRPIEQLVPIETAVPPPPPLVSSPGRPLSAGNPLPLPPPPPAFDFHHPTEGPPRPVGPISERRGWARAALAVGVTVAVLASAVVFVLARGEQHASGTTLALSFKPGQVYRFHLVNRITGTFSSDAAGLNAPIDVGVDETVAFRVISVDRDGITTARVKIEDATATANGASSPGPAGKELEMRIARDGRILQSGGVAFGSEEGAGAAFPGTDQFMPILPDGKVAPGDSWSKSFTVRFPLGDGAIRYETENTLQRYEPLNGVRAAVIQSDIKIPLKLTIDPRTFFVAAGTDESEIPPDFHGTLRYDGRMESVQTAWYDAVGRQTLKSSARGTVDLRMSFEGFKGADQLGEIQLLGTFDTQFENLTGR